MEKVPPLKRDWKPYYNGPYGLDENPSEIKWLNEKIIEWWNENIIMRWFWKHLLDYIYSLTLELIYLIQLLILSDGRIG